MRFQELFSRREPYQIVVLVTPEIAEDWLTNCNVHNRKLIDSHVEYLANEIRAGRWRLTHQGIAFSANGVLLDGQHRLWAVVLAGMPALMRVFVNQPAETMSVIDTGQRRRNDQIITLTGNLGEVTPHDLAILRSMFICYPHRRSPEEEGELLSRHFKAVRFAQEILIRSRTFRHITTAITYAVLARAWYSADHSQLRHFAEVLSTGRPIGEHDQPILLLFQFLIGATAGSRKRTDRHECYSKIERALSAFLHHEKPHRLYAAPHELFPLPEEAQAAAV